MSRSFPSPETPPLERDIYTVTRLNQEIRSMLETGFAQVWVEGEISNLSAPGSGHLYFSLKDGQAQMRCAFFRNRRSLFSHDPRDGDKIVVRARVTMYDARGDVQLVVQHMEAAGAGDLQRAFEQLKRRLAAEGLFDEAHKRAIPGFPARIGVITSPTGAAIRDIITTCRRRAPHIPLLLYPSTVQGLAAVDDLCAALSLANKRRECDVLIIARGGGAIEDLHPFNQERLARAIFHCTIPIVSAVGHQTDFSITDFVADMRAATPTAAAELVSPDALALGRHLHATHNKLLTLMNGTLQRLAQQTDWLSRRVTHPADRLRRAHADLMNLGRRLGAVTQLRLQHTQTVIAGALGHLMRRKPDRRLAGTRSQLRNTATRLSHVGAGLVDTRRNRLSNLSNRLNTVSPLATLDRGYALATQASKVIIDADRVKIGSDIDVRLARGALKCLVREKGGS